MSNWKALATEAMNTLDFNKPQLVYATIEAETGGNNKLGDDGRAFGYGQVWLKWHFNKLVKVANQLNVILPSYKAPQNEAEEEKFKNVILGNDRLSMYLAVETIKGYWGASGGDWVKFTKGYVGPAIPSSDLQRRQKIYEKYGGAVQVTESYKNPVLPAVPAKGEIILQKLGQVNSGSGIKPEQGAMLVGTLLVAGLILTVNVISGVFDSD